MTLEEQRRLLSKVAFLEQENTQLKEKVHAMRIDCAFWHRQNRLANAGLSPVSKDRINNAFAQSTDNAGLKEAINVEKRGAK